MLTQTPDVQTSPANERYDSANEMAEIKNLLLQSVKNTELISNMLLEQTKLLQQQLRQTDTMIQLLTNVTLKRNNQWLLTKKL